jgi:ribonuclease HI/uncharacterized phage-like protein YoqJ
VPTTVYCDGACIGNPGPGGWAWAMPKGPFASGAEGDTTNQRMEMTAALEALRATEGDVVIVSDSKYVTDCFAQRWYQTWEAKGWRNSKKQAVANQDLWRSLLAEYRKVGRTVTFEWVKGHGSDPMNDAVDRLATEAATTQQSRSGSEPPKTLGPADDPVRSSSSKTSKAGDLPAGWRVLILGHRPPQLGGYDLDNPTASEVRRRITEILGGVLAVHDEVVVVSGLGLGAEQIGAEAAIAAGVPYAVVLAFPDSETVWPFESQRRFRRLLSTATASITLSSKTPKSKQEAGMAIGSRNTWLIERADAAIVVSNGQDRDLRVQIASLEGRVPEDVWVIEP